MKKNTIFTLVAMNLMALATLFGAKDSVAAVNPDAGSAKTPDQQAALNAASLKSIESSWINVPHICKAKGFNADPAHVMNEKPSAAAQAVYEQVEA